MIFDIPDDYKLTLPEMTEDIKVLKPFKDDPIDAILILLSSNNFKTDIQSTERIKMISKVVKNF